MPIPLQIVSWALIALTSVLFVRLTATASRERSLPEGLMAAFFFGGMIGYGALMLPTSLGLPPEAHAPWRAVSGLFFTIPATAVAIFTWRVFRPEQAWARWLGLGLAAVIVGLHGAGYVMDAGWTEQTIPGSVFGGVLYWGGTSTRAFALGWAAVESLLYYRKARRQVALGLGDRVVANRFLLFAIWSSMAAAMLVLRVISRLNLDPATGLPVQSVPLALGQMVSSLILLVAIWLTFAAPQAYRRWIAGSASA